MECYDIEPVEDCGGFIIAQSDDEAQHAHAAVAAVTVDTAVCDDCLAELSDARDRRHRYGLINCTNCGPRYAIIERVPYDRPNTTMAAFEMCPDCRREYTAQSDRRFHAQPVACHICGPCIELVDSQGRAVHGDPYKEAARRLERGDVLAIKGLGGFHMSVRADDDAAVTRLRTRKSRDHKPFAVMCRSMDAAHRLVQLGDQAVRLMQSPWCPILLAPQRDGACVADGVAPGNHRLGVMLPYTPMQHLLFDELDNAVEALVMTSGNVSNAPLVIDNDEAVERLGPMCAAILRHDRPIARPVDDSVLLDMPHAAPLPFRRARGYVPQAIALTIGGDVPGLCVGGELNNTIAVVRDGEAILSHHLGDLRHPLAFVNFKQAADDLCALFDIEPHWIAHDLHPTYLSTQHAQTLSRQWGVPLIGVGHHHAHAASVLAEHQVASPALAAVCDGMGYGPDGAIWGGELLLTDLLSFRHLGHLRPLRLAGGDAAARDARRCALGLLHQTFGKHFAKHPATARLIPNAQDRHMLCAMIQRNVNCVQSTAAGRVFDGVAALLGICLYNQFEAKAPIALEAAASRFTIELRHKPLFTVRNGCIDLSPLIETIATGEQSVEEKAALFHEQFALAWADIIIEQASVTGVQTVALSGGVFCNQQLTERLTAALEEEGLTVLRHSTVPPTDGGLSLGQAAVAAARVSKGNISCA